MTQELMKAVIKLMHFACINDMAKAKELIEAKVDLNMQNEYGSTALMLAIQYNSIEVAEMLINAGANLDLQNDWGCTALRLAIYYNRIEIIEMLKKAGAKE